MRRTQSGPFRTVILLAELKFNHFQEESMLKGHLSMFSITCEYLGTAALRPKPGRCALLVFYPSVGPTSKINHVI